MTFPFTSEPEMFTLKSDEDDEMVSKRGDGQVGWWDVWKNSRSSAPGFTKTSGKSITPARCAGGIFRIRYATHESFEYVIRYFYSTCINCTTRATISPTAHRAGLALTLVCLMSALTEPPSQSLVHYCARVTSIVMHEWRVHENEALANRSLAYL